jgi:hypothetical protein
MESFWPPILPGIVVDRLQGFPANCRLILVRPIKTSIAVITFLAIPSATLHAGVGETVKQVEARYGKPERVLYEHGGVRKLGYRYRGLLVIECYVAGVSKSEFFARPDHQRQSDADVQQLLALSLAPGTTWKRLPDLDGDQTWIRSDGKVVALLNEHKFLRVQEKDFHEPKA